MLLGAGFGPAWSRRGRFHPICWEVPMEVTPATGSLWGRMLRGGGGKRGDVAVQGEEWVPERGWGAGRSPQGGTKTRGHLGCGWGRGTLEGSHPPAARPSARAVLGWGAFPSGFGVCASPQFSRMAMGSLHWKEPLALPDSHLGGVDRDVPWLPGPRATVGHSHLGPRKWCKSGAEPQAELPLQTGVGAAAIAILPPSTEPPCHGSGLTPGCPHAGDCRDTSVPLLGHRQSSAVTNPSPEPPVKDNRGTGTRMPARRSQHVRERWSRAGANLPPRRHRRTPPSTLLQSPASLQNTPAPSEKNPGVTAPGQPWAALCPTAGYKHPPRVGKLRQRCAAGNLGALAPLKQLAFRHQAAASHATPM